MANDLSSNTTSKVMRAFVKNMEKQRVLSKTVNSQVFQGEFTPQFGDTIYIKRAHRYNAIRTTAGDISSSTKSDIISGKAAATVQDYITVAMEWTNREESLEMDQLEKILMPAAEQCVIELETSLCDYMIKNAALSIGTPGTVIDAWGDIASQMSLMKSIGVPAGEHYSVMNPFTVQNLANAQAGLAADPSRLVQTAWENAQISSPFAGLRALSSNSLSTYTAGTDTTRTGTLSATPDGTYLTHKDTMIQSIAVTGLDIAGTIKAGEILEFTGTGADARSYIHQRTGKTVFDSTGAPIPWRCTVTEDVTLDGSGAGTLLVSGAAINETDGQYNNISAPLTSGDVFVVLGTEDTEYQPNLFYNKDAFGVAYIKLAKLYSTDTIATSQDGLSVRVSKYADGDANKQMIRMDLLPAFGTLDPFMAGKGFGIA